MKKLLSPLALFSCLLSVSAFATTWEESQSIFANYHFTEFAYGKKVSTVYVHTGVLRDNRSTCGMKVGTYWENTQHIKMDHLYGHFYAKAIFSPTTGQCQATIEGPVVQYWIYFADGSEMKTEVTKVPTTLTAKNNSSDFEMSQRQLGNDFARWGDWNQTQAWGYSFTHSD